VNDVTAPLAPIQQEALELLEWPRLAEQLASFAANKKRIVCRACPAPRPAFEDRELVRVVSPAVWCNDRIRVSGSGAGK
jgi:hypothetical protein